MSERHDLSPETLRTLAALHPSDAALCFANMQPEEPIAEFALRLLGKVEVLRADLYVARDLLRQATRGGRDMPGHAEVVGGPCLCATCAELRRLTGWGVGKE